VETKKNTHYTGGSAERLMKSGPAFLLTKCNFFLVELFFWQGVYASWQSDYANDLAKLGSWATTNAVFGYDHMVGWPGYDAVPKYLAKGIDVLLNKTVTRISLGKSKVTVTTTDTVTKQTVKYSGNQVLVTVPIGVLQNRQIEFKPQGILPPRLWQAIDTMGVMGVMEKVGSGGREKVFV